MALGKMDIKSHDEPADSDADETASALSAFGLVAEFTPDPGPEVFHLWPEHEPVFALWLLVQTQWRSGLAGATGLDYAGIESFLRLRGLPRAERAERFAQMQIMERAALAAWASQEEVKEHDRRAHQSVRR